MRVKHRTYKQHKATIKRYRRKNKKIEIYLSDDLYKRFKALKTELDLNSYALLLKELLDCYGG